MRRTRTFLDLQELDGDDTQTEELVSELHLGVSIPFDGGPPAKKRAFSNPPQSPKQEQACGARTTTTPPLSSFVRKINHHSIDNTTKAIDVPPFFALRENSFSIPPPAKQQHTKHTQARSLLLATANARSEHDKAKSPLLTDALADQLRNRVSLSSSDQNSPSPLLLSPSNPHFLSDMGEDFSLPPARSPFSGLPVSPNSPSLLHQEVTFLQFSTLCAICVAVVWALYAPHRRKIRNASS